MEELLLELKQNDIDLEVINDRIKLDIPKGFNNPKLLEKIRLNKNNLINYYVNVKRSESKIIPLVKVKPFYKVSSKQSRLYALQELNKNGVEYNMPSIYILKGNLDIKLFSDSIDQIVQRHESLRTYFEIENDELVQKVLPKVNFSIPCNEINETTIENTINGFIRPFDLSNAPILRIELYQVASEKHLLMIDMHHIISDGVSLGIFMKELSKAYRGESLEKLKIQYKDYSEWEQEKIKGSQLEIQKDYWINIFKDEIPALELPTDYSRPRIRDFKGGQYNFEFSEDMTTSVKKMCKNTEVTLFTLLLGIYKILLSKYSNQEDLIVGTFNSGRDNEHLDKIIGMFVNTLAIRSRPEGNKKFIDYIKELQQICISTFDNQHYPFEELVEELDMKQDMSRNPLFDATFLLQNYEYSPLQLNQIEVQRHKISLDISKFDLSLITMEKDDRLSFIVEYSKALFHPSTIERMFFHFNIMVQNILLNKDIRISEIELSDEKEKNKLIYDFNKTILNFPKKNESILGLFEKQVEKTPDKISCKYKEYHLTYRQLNNCANYIASLIHDKTKGGTRKYICLYFDPSVEMIACILGILKADCIYVPLSPDSPDKRNEIIYSNCKAVLLMVQENLAERVRDNLRIDKGQIITMKDIINFDIEQVHRKILPEDPFYSIYTSGTTGTPKGVIVKNKGILNMVLFYQKLFKIKEGTTISQIANIGFDAAAFEIWPSLTLGGCLNISPKEIRMDTDKIKSWLINNGIELTFQPTPIAELLLKEDWLKVRNNLKIMNIAGDVLSYIPEKKLPFDIYNLYGPTEDSVWTTWHKIEVGIQDYYSIGKPIANKKIFIVDKYNNLQPIGIPGELCIAGDGLAQGYVNNRALTLEKYVECPFLKGQKMYKTGDEARWQPDGNIEFLGRIDSQVKIRGFRIELGEIEACIKKIDDVKDAVVTVLKSESGEKTLCAYLVTDVRLNIELLRNNLANLLPDYMMPDCFNLIDKIPLTQNGKVDKKSLPEPNFREQIEYIEPTNELQVKLTKLWAEILKIKTNEIGINTSFFRLGGHSLKAVKLSLKLKNEFNIEISLTELFSNPTIRNLETLIQNKNIKKQRLIVPAIKKPHYKTSSEQRRLYALQELNKNGIVYNMPAVFELYGQLDFNKLSDALAQIVSRHESFRSYFEIENEELVQKILPSINFSIPYKKISETNIDSIVNGFTRPFDLNRAPLLRIELYQVSSETHFLMIDMHHIISDGVSMGIFIKDLNSAYQGEQLEELQIQYKDFSEWEQGEIRGKEINKQKDYWTNIFKGEIPLLELPTDYRRPKIRDFKGGLYIFEFSEDGTSSLKTMCKNIEVTLFTVLLGIYKILLSKYSNQEDLVVGTINSGRDQANLDKIIGMFVNTLALRSRPEGNKRFIDYIKELQRICISAFDNQDYPFEELVEELDLERDMSRNPLFDVLFVLQNYENEPLQLNQLEVRRHNLGLDISKFDLSLTALEKENKLLFIVEYSEALFHQSTIERMFNHFLTICNNTLSNEKILISDIEIIDEHEKKKLLFDFNDTESPINNSETIVSLFNKKKLSSSTLTAVISKDSSISYNELDYKSDLIANYLRQDGIKSNDLVAIDISRSTELIITILGILKSGAGYLTLNHSIPKDRYDYIIEDSKAKQLICMNQDNICNTKIKTVSYNHIIENFCSKDYLPEIEIHPTNLAYVIYTSGTTGKPKGVQISHASLLNFIFSMTKAFGSDIDKSDACLCLTNVLFDVSVGEIFFPLLNGAKLILTDNEGILTPEYIADVIVDKKITFAYIPPSLLDEVHTILNTFNKESIYLNKLLVGVEPINYKTLDNYIELISDIQIINGYGPTETTICSTMYKYAKGNVKSGIVPIGRPVQNTKVYILDKYQKLMPIGSIGELYISGYGLSMGYINATDADKSRFIPLALNGGDIAYRTGDLAKFLPDGNLIFQGRKDNQVKLNGYRIELSEIEQLILNYKGINKVVVHLFDNDGEKLICAYYVAAETIAEKELNHFLAYKLPVYMLPSYFKQIDKIPLTQNGKIDIKNLPLPVLNDPDKFQAPSSETEIKLVGIWADVLKIEAEQISINASFFRLGGNSIKAVKLLSILIEEFSVNIEFIELYTNFTIKSIAIELNRKMKLKDMSLSIDGQNVMRI